MNRLTIVAIALNSCFIFTAANAQDKGGPRGALLSHCESPEVARLFASEAEVGNQTGQSIALSGDTAVVGSPYGSASGGAYIFIGSGGVWTEQQKLTPTGVSDGSSFGLSVAISGDTAVVGAREDDGGGTNAGAAVVFTRSGTVWTQQQKLTAADAAEFDGFGYSVAIFGDTVVVGAEYDFHSGMTGAGSAYVFVRSGGVWTQQQKLTASDAGEQDRFGTSVAIENDTIVVGASNDHHVGSFGTGSAYAFTRTGTVWTEQAKLIASDPGVSARFGNAVALSGETALIGSVGDDFGGWANSGSAYVFTRSGTVWTQQQKLNIWGNVYGIYFGDSVAISGDRALIGAPYATSATAAGEAYFFLRSGGVWSQQPKIVASDAENNDVFGFSVALSGTTAVIGAPGEDPSGIAIAGSAYVFELVDCVMCSEDLDIDGHVGVPDLLFLINLWGFCPGCPPDLNGDDQVGVPDLLAIINAWGPCQ